MELRILCPGILTVLATQNPIEYEENLIRCRKPSSIAS
jgi:hypothetical protein